MSAGVIAAHYVDTASTSYNTEVLADSPLVYLKLGDASGATATDSSGNSRAATYTGSPTLGVTGLITAEAETAVTLNGTSQYATITGGSWMNVSTYTCEIIFKATATTGFLYSRDDGNTNSKIWDLQLTSGKLQFTTFTTTGTGVNVITTNTYNDGLPHRVIVTRASTTATIFVDGVQDGSGSTASPASSSTTLGISVGRRGNNSGFLAGTIEKFAFYSGVLSGARIAAHQAAGA